MTHKWNKKLILEIEITDNKELDWFTEKWIRKIIMQNKRPMAIRTLGKDSVYEALVAPKQEEVQPLCRNCTFAYGIYCRRFPPQIPHPSDRDNMKWPSCQTDDGCGEFKPKR